MGGKLAADPKRVELAAISSQPLPPLLCSEGGQDLPTQMLRRQAADGGASGRFGATSTSHE